MTPASDLRYGAIPGEFETSPLNDNSEMEQLQWGNEVLDNGMNFEPTAVPSEFDSVQAFLPDSATHSAEIADRSYEAQIAARNAERYEAAEREQYVAYAHTIGAHVRNWRDRELAATNKQDWTLAA